ncbi:MAG: hypothetical protein F4X66_14800 [Chloroflexi bacterium]|nr:hypothetical protein [Chloroflexota bacterium]MYE41523.1 hypothetical protein [Chloroflexota bacterium]
MTTEYNNEDDPYLRPYRPDLDDESDEDDESDDLVTDLDEAAAEFRMRYYGPDNNPQPPAAMVELAPEVMRLVDAVVYGEIYNRPAVDLKTRSLCTIAALVVLGHSPQMIKRHITGALHIGVTEEEISEIIAQMVFYGGMPAAVNAFRIAKETFDEQAGVTPAAPPPSARAGGGSPSGFAPPYRRENVGDYGPDDLSDEEPPIRVRPRVGPGQEATGRTAPGAPPQGGPRREGGSSDRRPSDRRERDEDRVHRNRQHGQSDGRQPNSGRPPANRPRPATGGRNQSSGDGRRLGGQPQRGRPGQRRGPNQPPRPQGRRGGGPGRGRSTGGRR